MPCDLFMFNKYKLPCLPIPLYIVKFKCFIIAGEPYRQTYHTCNDFLFKKQHA